MCVRLLSLTNENFGILQKLVRWHFKVEWGWSLTDTARDIVVRSVAWAEPAVEIPGIVEWDTPQVGTDTQDNQPLRLVGTIGITLMITEVCHGHTGWIDSVER